MGHIAPARAHRLARDWPLGRVPPEPGGFDERPVEQLLDGTAIVCSGWAWPFADERVRSVELLLDGEPAGRARLTLRADVAEALRRPEAALSGFEGRVELAAGSHAELLSATVHGLDGSSWTAPGLRLPSDLATDDAGAEGAPGASVDDATTDRQRDDAGSGAANAGGSPAARLDRELERRRLGYDPEHTVVLIDGPALEIAGPAIAALDVLAERQPGLELLIAGVPPESAIADVLRRTIEPLGLADRVTVPVGGDPGYWRAVADAQLDTTTADDLAATIDALTRSVRSKPR